MLYTEQARELAQSGGIDDVALEEMSEAEKQAELAKREAEKASQAFQKWVRISNRSKNCVGAQFTPGLSRALDSYFQPRAP